MVDSIFICIFLQNVNLDTQYDNAVSTQYGLQKYTKAHNKFIVISILLVYTKTFIWNVCRPHDKILVILSLLKLWHLCIQDNAGKRSENFKCFHIRLLGGLCCKKNWCIGLMLPFVGQRFFQHPVNGYHSNMANSPLYGSTRKYCAECHAIILLLICNLELRKSIITRK